MPVEVPEIVEVDSSRVACDGIGGGLGHPRVYLEMGDENFVECPIATAALSCVPAPRAIIIESEKGRSPLSGGRLGLSVPRLSRLAAAHPQGRRTAHRRGVRLLQHAVEAHGGHEGGRCAQPSGGDFRRQRTHLPQRNL